MTEIRYADLVIAPPRITVTGMGTQAGPPGGDGWQIVHVLGHARMRDGARQYAFVVNGKISNRQTNGGGIARAMFQVCLGTVAGARWPHHRASHMVALPLGPDDGIPFQFLVIVSTAVPDEVIGSSIDPATTELCIWARTTWNNDPQTYVASFDVADLTWLWWDLTDIPSGHWAAHQVLPSPATSLPASAGSFTALSSPIGAAGEQWLHFQHVWYEPRVYNQPSTQWALGYTPDGTVPSFVARCGAGGWGMSRFPPIGNLPEVGQIQQGGFWVHTHANSTTRAAAGGWSPSPGSTTFRRYNHLAVRIDTLPDVRVRAEAGPLQVGGPATTEAWRQNAVVVERPAAGILTEPIVLVHGVMREANGTFGGHAIRVLEEANGPWWGETAAPQVEASRGEGASSIAVGRRAFMVTSPAIQWRAAFAGSGGVPPSPQVLRDFQWVSFHPVRDPNNITTPPGGLPSPFVVVPDRQSPAVGSLLDPPHPPSSALPQRVRHERPAIRGTTGYRRSWPLGARPLKELSLVWGAMPRAEGQAVFDFLRANVAWRYTAPRASAVAVMSTSQPQMEDIDHLNVTVSIDVAILTFTGP